MNNRNSRRNRRNRSNQPENSSLVQTITSDNSKIIDKLHELVSLETTQTRGIMPTVPDVPRLKISRNKIYTFERVYNLPAITSPASVDVSGVIGPSLSQFPGYTDLTSLFDQYRIIQIQIDFVPSSSSGVYVPFYSAIDYDDYTVAAGLGDLLQYQTLMVTQSAAVHTRVFNPRIAAAAYGGVVFTSYANLPGTTWIDVASPSVNYYGLKYYWPAGASTGILTPVVKAVIQCRSVR